jgi:hypothetical protein
LPYRGGVEVRMDGLLEWFDLSSPQGPFGIAGEAGMPIWEQLLLYLVVVLGVLLSEAVAMARRGGPIRVDLSWTWVAIACVVALVVFPAVWRDLGIDQDASLLVHMGLAAQGGVFWGVLMAGAEKQVES